MKSKKHLILLIIFWTIKISFSAISKLAEINIDRSLPVFSVQDDPKVVAIKIRKELYPDFNPMPKEFLRALISKFAEKNIFDKFPTSTKSFL